MSDNTKTFYNMVAQNSESTVVAEYTRQVNGVSDIYSRSYQSESELDLSSTWKCKEIY